MIDVGGLGPADPALDLVGAWHLHAAAPRQILRNDLNCDDVEWERGKAWAFEQSRGAIWYYVESNPAMSLMSRLSMQRIMADAPPNRSRAETAPGPATPPSAAHGAGKPRFAGEMAGPALPWN